MSEEATKKNRNKYDVSPERFVQVWQESNSAQEVADKLKMPKNIVLARSAVYRKNRPDGTPGVPLKKMERKNPRKLDVASLTALANKGVTAPAAQTEQTESNEAEG